MDKQIQFSINRNMLIAVLVVIGVLVIALSAGRGRHDRMMMRGGDMQGGQRMMMQKKMPAGTPVGEEQRLMRPPTEQELASSSIDLQ